MDSSFSFSFTSEPSFVSKSFYKAIFPTEDQKQWNKAKDSAEEVEYEECNNKK